MFWCTTIAFFVCFGPSHRFYSRSVKVELTAAVAAAALDSATTCDRLADGHSRETSLPTQRCSMVNVMLFGQVAVQEGVAYGLHRLRLHRAEKVVRFFSIEENVRGVTFTARHGGL